MKQQLTAAYQECDGCIIAYIEEIPGVNTQARSLEEARASLEDALAIFLRANRELAQRGIGGRVGVVEEPFAVLSPSV